MTRGSILEYTVAVRGRYLGATKKEKGRILDEFTKVVGCHRKAAISLLRHANQPRGDVRIQNNYNFGKGGCVKKDAEDSCRLPMPLQ